jgi:hypothetical protein
VNPLAAVLGDVDVPFESTAIPCGWLNCPGKLPDVRNSTPSSRLAVEDLDF